MAIGDLNTVCTFKESPTSVRTLLLADLQQLRIMKNSHYSYVDAVVNNLEDAHELIDTAISTALKATKPVYISISCNLPAIPHPTFGSDPVPFTLSPNNFWTNLCKLSNKMGLEAEVGAAAEFLNKDKTIIVQPDRDICSCRTEHKQPLRVDVLLQYIQNMLSSEATIFAEARDSWFNCQKLKLPTGCGMDRSGGQLALPFGTHRLFQRNVRLLESVMVVSRSEEELIKAIETATRAMKDCLCFIQVIVHKADTSKELLEWGCRVAATNGRPPYPQ
ncbi:pyruvate decarboxylase 2-like [Gossypium arboreum]|uniref:pyruvate decarboxylase 2-like n=1 Tax=Gossypium arboreum TaxID=29729 RepID=UPI0022F17004|nr:pyruvate decarboxylase 2-like [Gossypium arboreum]